MLTRGSHQWIELEGCAQAEVRSAQSSDCRQFSIVSANSRSEQKLSYHPQQHVRKAGMAQHYRTSIESTIISLPKVQLKLTGVLSHITVITIQPVCERMSETAQQLGAERATAAGCFVSFRLAERYGGRRNRVNQGYGMAVVASGAIDPKRSFTNGCP